jgi:DNA (cytosine-5)-methyltransferase 1
MNRDAKEHHPVYNNMAFPDPLDKPARTVTATCTRVSRESIVIADPRQAGQFRRLTIRERASLQGFPITYQFFARSFSEKAKMIGNAIPPTFTYLVALNVLGVSASDFGGFVQPGRSLRMPPTKGPVTPPDAEGKSYPAARVFRAALPGFRFKSGMRFDLSNSMNNEGTEWAVRFYFGPSKDIRQIDLDGSATQDLSKNPQMADILGGFQVKLARLQDFLAQTDSQALQLVWTHKSEGIGPHDLTDRLAAVAEDLYELIDAALSPEGRADVARYVVEVATGSASDSKLVSKAKLERHSVRVLAGIIIGEWFNTLAWHQTWKQAA